MLPSVPAHVGGLRSKHMMNSVSVSGRPAPFDSCEVLGNRSGMRIRTEAWKKQQPRFHAEIGSYERPHPLVCSPNYALATGLSSGYGPGAQRVARSVSMLSSLQADASGGPAPPGPSPASSAVSLINSAIPLTVDSEGEGTDGDKSSDDDDPGFVVWELEEGEEDDNDEDDDYFPEIVLDLPTPTHTRVKTAIYLKSCVLYTDCPPPRLPEFAVIGRSNVGKSSLINSLTSSKRLAHVSKEPGKTRCINHFLINNSWYLVDLPGYGYARTGFTQRAQFEQFTLDYFLNRPSLAMVFLLIDGSIPPQTIDLEYAAWLADHGVPFSIIFTKVDKKKKKKAGAPDNITAFKRALLSGAQGQGPTFRDTIGDGEGEQKEEIVSSGGDGEQQEQQQQEQVVEEEEEEEEPVGFAALPPSVATSAADGTGKQCRGWDRGQQQEQVVVEEEEKEEPVGSVALPPSVATSAADGTGRQVRLRGQQQEQVVVEEEEKEEPVGSVALPPSVATSAADGTGRQVRLRGQQQEQVVVEEEEKEEPVGSVALPPSVATSAADGTGRQVRLRGQQQEQVVVEEEEKEEPVGSVALPPSVATSAADGTGRQVRLREQQQEQVVVEEEEKEEPVGSVALPSSVATSAADGTVPRMGQGDRGQQQEQVVVEEEEKEEPVGSVALPPSVATSAADGTGRQVRLRGQKQEQVVVEEEEKEEEPFGSVALPPSVATSAADGTGRQGAATGAGSSRRGGEGGASWICCSAFLGCHQCCGWDRGQQQEQVVVEEEEKEEPVGSVALPPSVATSAADGTGRQCCGWDRGQQQEQVVVEEEEKEEEPVGFAALPPSVATSAADGTGKQAVLHLIAGLRIAMEESGRLQTNKGLQPRLSIDQRAPERAATNIPTVVVKPMKPKTASSKKPKGPALGPAGGKSVRAGSAGGSKVVAYASYWRYLSRRSIAATQLERIAYHGEDANVVSSPCLTQAACSTVVAICEAHAAANEAAGLNGWHCDQVADYAFTTVDLEVANYAFTTVDLEVC
eukprot:gene10992-18987_t